MKVAELKKALKGIPDSAEVILHDDDTGDDYVATKVIEGYVRETKWKTGHSAFDFDKNEKSLNVSLSEMQDYGIVEYKIYHAIEIE